MKFKKLLTRITTLVLAICILISTDLVAFANSTDMGSDDRDHWGNSGDGTNWLNGYGVRLTFVDATNNGEPVVVNGVTSVDWNTSNNISSCRSFKKKCKSAYRSGESLEPLPSYYCNPNPPAIDTFKALMVSWDQDDINDYFKGENVVKALVNDLTNCGLANAEGQDLYKNFANGTYNILVEPMGCYRDANKIEYMATATEYAKANEIMNWWMTDGMAVVRGELPRLLYFKEAHDNIGYGEDAIDPVPDSHSFDGSPRYYATTVLNKALGVGLIWTKEPPTGEPQLITHTCYINYTPSDATNIYWSDVMKNLRNGNPVTLNGVTISSFEDIYNFALQKKQGFAFCDANTKQNASKADSWGQSEVDKNIDASYVFDASKFNGVEIGRHGSLYGIVSAERTGQDVRGQRAYPEVYEERRSRADIASTPLAVQSGDKDIHVLKICPHLVQEVKVINHYIYYTTDPSGNVTKREWEECTSETWDKTKHISIDGLSTRDGISYELRGTGQQNSSQYSSYVNSSNMNKYPDSSILSYTSGVDSNTLEVVTNKSDVENLAELHSIGIFLGSGSATRVIHAVYVAYGPAKPETDRIKTHDLTQYLDVTSKSPTKNGHTNPSLIVISSNTGTNSEHGHAGDVTAWLKSDAPSIGDPSTKEHVSTVYGAKFSSNPSASYTYSNGQYDENNNDPDRYYAAFSVPHKYMVNTEVLKGSKNPSFGILSASDTDSLFIPRDDAGNELAGSQGNDIKWEQRAGDALKDSDNDTAHFTNYGWDQIKSVGYVAHRDIFSGGNSTSLAVSGYMAKYATNAQTWDYLKLMGNSHFGFTGINSLGTGPDSLSFTNDASNIAHIPGKVHVANANTTATSNLNPSYVSARDVNFNFGSKSVNMYKHMDNSNLADAELADNSQGHGDAVRSIWYKVTLDQDFSGTPSHATDNRSYLKNTYDAGSYQIFGTTARPSHLVSSIYTYVRNATARCDVEGTFNGKRDASGQSGMTYDTSMFTVDNGCYMHNPTALDKAYTENAVKVSQFNLADVGQPKHTNGSEQVYQEYRFTTPSNEYTFNPSVAMAFDDRLKDMNKAAWVISEQPMKINFKNTLDIRLTTNTGSNAGTTGSKTGYPTQIDSEWSTDKGDVDIQNDTLLPTTKASNTYKTKTGVVGGTITAYVVLQDPEFSGDPTAVKAQNEATLEAYTEQMEEIRKQFANAVGDKTTNAANIPGNKNNFGLAMYTNMQNGSSQNSAMSEPNLAADQNRLDKEQMKLDTDSLMSAKVTTGTNSRISAGLTTNSWSFYALDGYKVYNTYSPDPSLGISNTTDISNTTSGGKRFMFGRPIRAYTAAARRQQDIMDEMNKHLCELLVEQGTEINVPTRTSPFNNGKRIFDWYNEDYEGFVVAVCEISFAIGNDKGDASYGADTSRLASTNFHSIYQAQSDWRTETNKYGSISPNREYHHQLEYDFSGVASKYGISNITGSYSECSDGKMLLVSNTGKTTIRNWSKEYDNYANGIYGVGLEIANLKFEFGSITSRDASGNETGWSFFYQPTYFNIRGSVYDTAR